MRLKQYINELAMKKGTIIKAPIYKVEDSYKQDIILSNGLKFKFVCHNFRNAFGFEDGLWEVSFEDEEKRKYQVQKPEGTVLELFAALQKVLITFLSKTNPSNFRFTADVDEKSRVKLYDIIAKKLKKKGWKYSKKSTSIACQHKK